MSETKSPKPKANPPYQADVDYEQWAEYLEDCEENEVQPTVSDYLMWLGEDGYDPLT